MLYHLLYPLAGRFTPFNVLRYPSFRIIAAGFTALLLGLLLGPLFIERMREIQYGASNVREDTPDTAHHRLGLTPREREVLALVADGRTNRQIAEALFISDKTASVHVSNILAKLGVANRAEAAVTAHRLGLTLSPGSSP